MKPQRDIERTLDRWFAPGADRVPERVLDRALANIDHITQRRAGSASGRFNMPTNLRILAVAATLVLAGGVAYLLVGSNRSTTAPPTAVLSIQGGAATWSATRPSVFGHPAGTYEFDTYSPLVGRSPDGITIDLGPIAADGTTATVGGTDQCDQEGTYRYRYSVDYLTLVVDAVKDPCTDRRTLIEGEWLRVRSDVGLEIGHAYAIDMGVRVEFVVPPWPAISGPGPYVITEGSPGTAPRLLRVGTNLPSTSTTAYELRLVVDPRPAIDVCDIAKGWFDTGWTLDDFAARTAPESATFSPPTRTTVSGFPAVTIDVAGSPSCSNDRSTKERCCPDDIIDFSTAGREWAVDLGSRKVLIMFVGNQHGVTPKQLAVGSALVSALRLTVPTD